MIDIKDKKLCCGCSACAQRCPNQCITMQSDAEGFLYPIVNTAECIDCRLCEMVCPVINQSEPCKPIYVYAAYNKNEEVRSKSSSGGIFTLFAEIIISKGGVVFGVKFNEEWMPIFDYTETVEGITAFRGSKYVQAIVGNAYCKAEEFLKAGREVLFSGTPCQIAGLKRYLRKEYDNLLTVDIICHGVPSPKVWDIYLKETCSKLLKDMPYEKKQSVIPTGETYKSCIETISFRSKITGWKKYSFLLKLNYSTNDGKNTVVFNEAFDENDFMDAFLSNIILRPSCHACPAKQGKGHSDITIADFWGINIVDPTFDDDKGCCAVLLNSVKGKVFFPVSRTIYKEKTRSSVIEHNFSYYGSCVPHINRKKFFARLDSVTDLSQYIFKMKNPSLISRIMNKVKGCINRVLI